MSVAVCVCGALPPYLSLCVCARRHNCAPLQLPPGQQLPTAAAGASNRDLIPPAGAETYTALQYAGCPANSSAELWRIGTYIPQEPTPWPLTFAFFLLQLLSIGLLGRSIYWKSIYSSSHLIIFKIAAEVGILKVNLFRFTSNHIQNHLFTSIHYGCYSCQTLQIDSDPGIAGYEYYSLNMNTI